MATIKNYVGPEAKIRSYFGRKRTANQPEDLVAIRELLNRIPPRFGGPSAPLTPADDVSKTKIFEAIETFQRHNDIINRKTRKPYGWTGPRGKTIPKMKRLAARASGPRRSGRQLDVSRISYERLRQHHLKYHPFHRRIGDYVFSSAGPLSDSRGVNTCALRMSYALMMVGKKLPVNRGSWQYRKNGSKAWLTSTAERISQDLADAEQIDGPEDIAGRKGIIAFVGGLRGASGHVTLWNGQSCHFGAGDAYWNTTKIFFWQLNG